MSQSFIASPYAILQAKKKIWMLFIVESRMSIGSPSRAGTKKGKRVGVGVYLDLVLDPSQSLGSSTVIIHDLHADVKLSLIDSIQIMSQFF
jgi:hypothetical protein